MHVLDDTIAAIASPPGGAARGMVRLSGPGLRKCLERCFRPDPYVQMLAVTAPTAIPGLLWLPGFASPVPCDLYLWPARRSYTGQSVAELHTLGSPPLLDAVLRTVCAGGARLAEPGEFTLRAFLAGRIDLTQAEAVLGVIDAADPTSLHAALSQLAGGLATPLYRLRDALLDLLAHLEAGFDFADEDLPFIAEEQLVLQLDEVSQEVQRLLERMTLRGDSDETVRVVLIGSPNAGKSSLFNALAQNTGALVSDQPGTTRDYLTVALNLDGVKCLLVDTAGMTVADGVASHKTEASEAAAQDISIAQAAQLASVEQCQQAHVQVLCVDATRPLNDWEQRILAQNPDSERILVLTKTDAHRVAVPMVGGAHPTADSVIVGGDSVGDRFPVGSSLQSDWIPTSSVTGSGLRDLRRAIREAVLQTLGPRGDIVAGTAVRCGDSLRLAAQCLDRGQELVQSGEGEELVAAEIRAALNELGKVAGAVYTEDVLERIFSRFCVGK